MVLQLSVAEEPREHRKGAHRKRLIDERLLTVQGFDGRATRQWVFRLVHIRDLGIEFADGAQALRLPTVPVVQGLSKDVLSARSVVAEIEPIGSLLSEPRSASSMAARAARLSTQPITMSG